jgi:hypothetical protein
MRTKPVKTDRGLLPDREWRSSLEGYPVELAGRIRRDLAERLPNLREKFNRNQRYFGYGLGESSDVVYIYLQKKSLVIDLRLDPKLSEEIERLGYPVIYRDNFQGRTGYWITGWRIPHDAQKETPIVNWLCRALTAPNEARGRGRKAQDPKTKEIGDRILRQTRKMISEATEGDENLKFRVNRWVFARMLGDEQKIKRPIKKALFEAGACRCTGGGQEFKSLKNVELHRKDGALAYSAENCVLLCRPCHSKET